MGDGAGIAAGQQLAAQDALIRDLLHQGAVVADDVVILTGEAEFGQIGRHALQRAARGQYHGDALGAGGRDGGMGAGVI